MKKVISLLLALTMMLSMLTVSVMAAQPATVTAKADYTTKTIDVVYNNTANYDCYVTIYMVDADIYDDAVFEDYDVDGSVVRMATVEADALSKVNVQLVLGADIKTGSYNFYAAPSGVKGEDYYAKISTPRYIIGEIANPGDDTVEDVIEYVNGGSASDISSRVFEKLEAALELESNPQWRNAYVYAIKADDFAGAFKSITEIGKAIETADAIYDLRTSLPDAFEAALINESGILDIDINNEDFVNEKYHENILSTYAAKIAEQDVKTQKHNKTAFEQSIALVLINTGDVSAKAKALQTYYNALGISDSLFSRIEGKGFDVVARHFENFTAQQASQVVTKVTEILNAIDKEPADDPVYVPNKNNGAPGGGVTLPNEFASQTTTPGYTTTFSDVPSSHWANESVEYLASLGVLAGKGNGIFAPDATVTREEFVKMIVAAFKYTNVGDGISFADVPSSYWAYSYIKVAYENNIVKGLSDTKFGVGSPITRQDMAVIIMRVVADKQIQLSGNASSFMDDAKIADYAKESVMELAAAGILNGYSDGTFKPEGSLTRAEAAKVIYALVNR